MNVDGYNNMGAHMMHTAESSEITIVINVLTKQYVITGGTVSARGSWSGTSYPVASGDCTFTITSIEVS